MTTPVSLLASDPPESAQLEACQTLLAVLAQVVWETDATGRVSADSPSWRAYTGHTVAQWLAGGWLEAVHPDDVTQADQQWQWALTRQEPLDIDLRLTTSDEEWRWSTVRATPVFGPDASVLKWLGAVVDITAKRQAEEALQQTDAHYHLLFESIDEGILLAELQLDVDGNPMDLLYQQANPGVERQLDLGNIVGKRMREVMPGADLRWLDFCNAVAKTGQPARTEYYTESIGRWHTVFVSRVGGAGSRQIAIVFDDITDRKYYERQQSYLLTLSDALRAVVDPIAIEETVTRLAMHHFTTDRCYYCRIEAGNAVISRDALQGDLPSVAGTYPLSRFPLLRQVIEEGRPFVVHDSHTTAMLDEDLRALCLELHVIAFLNVPVVKGERVVGVLCLVQSKPRLWTAAEIQLATETAERTWAAVEQARAEAALGRLEKHTRLAIDAAQMATWEWDLATGLIYRNEQFFHLLYLPLDTQRQDFELFIQRVHPDDRDRIQAQLQQTGQQGTPYDAEFRMIRADGSTRWMHGYGRVTAEEAGKPSRVSGVMFDITDRKLAEEALRQREQELIELRHLTLLGQTESIARIGSWEYDRQSNQFAWSAGMYRLTGIDPARPIQTDIYLALVSDDDRPQAEQLLTYLRHGKGSFETQLRIQVGDEHKTLRIKADVIGHGEQAHVFGVDMDITPHLQDQQRIHETADSLQAVLDASPASIGLLKAVRDPSGCIVNFRLAVGNDKLAQFFDQPLAQLLGQMAERFSALLWGECTVDRLRKVFTTQESFYEEKPLPPPHQDKWLAVSVTQQDDGVVLTGLDITALKESQLRQQHWLDELESSRESVEALTQLRATLQHRSESLRAVSHDLKSNFGIITGALSLLELADSETERSQVMDMALRNVKQATGLLGELLDLTRLEAHEQPRRIDQQNVSDLFRELIESVQPLAEERQLSLQVSGTDTLVVDTDSLVLYRLVQNLVMNALKYTHQGEVRLNWATEPANEQWWFSVADTGPGLAAELVARLNGDQPVVPGSDRSINLAAESDIASWASLRGEGIGLRIVREITALLMGRLVVDSQAGVGTTFTVRLPLTYPADRSMTINQ